MASHLVNKLIRIILLTLMLIVPSGNTKYVEGRLKTIEDWAFVARFCFLSGRGRYEYHIEFEKRYGEPKLLLYYDDSTQWPAVYKSSKNCQQKLSVLSAIDNQIVTLSPRSPYNVISGCTTRYKYNVTPKPPFDIRTTAQPVTTIPFINHNVDDSTYYDQFLVTESNRYRSSSSSTTAESAFEDVNIDDSEFAIEMFNFTGHEFNETADGNIYNGSLKMAGSSRGGMGRSFSHDVGYENELENSTEYRNDVEELFEPLSNVAAGSGSDGNDDGKKRVRRHLAPAMFSKPDGHGTVIVSCSNIGGFTSSRERWWYIAVSNCGNGKGIDITYQFRMTNGPPGDFWHEHFSADEMNIPPVLMTFSIAYTMVIIAMFICAIELKSMNLLHCTYRLFSFSVLMQFIGILAQGIAWSKYAITGIGPYTTLGGLFMGASEVSFLALLLLMAKGYTITRARLSSYSTVKLTVFVNIYVVSYVSLFIFQAETFDPGEVLNLYESPAGLGLTGLRCIAWIVFICSMISTMKKYPEKRMFYYPFSVLGSLWIMGGPIAIIFGISVLDPWVRESMMCAVLGLITFTGHISFLYLTWPSRANKSFPYHVRTNHVGIASDDDDGADYPRHTYEPSLPDQNLVIPLSRRTEELLNGVYSPYLTSTNIDADQNVENTTVPYLHRATTAPSHSRLGPHNRYPTAPPTNDDIDNQNDSGHLSLENSASPNDTRPSSEQQSPIRQQQHAANHHFSQDDPNVVHSSEGILKNNPFLINGIQRAPNKVILEPIEQSLRDMAVAGVNAAYQPPHHQHVPKHLFAVNNKRQSVSEAK